MDARKIYRSIRQTCQNTLSKTAARTAVRNDFRAHVDEPLLTALFNVSWVLMARFR